MDIEDEIANTITKINRNGLIYSIDNKQKISSVIGCQSDSDEFIIPRLVEYKSEKYIVTSISFHAFFQSKIKSIKFTSDSEIQAIEKGAFSQSSIESIMIPSSLIDLKERWCCLVHFLTRIDVSPDNPRYSTLDEKMIIGKSSIEQKNYDVLVFCVRDVEAVTIPSFIEVIGPNAFDRCMFLKKVEFPSDSKVHTFCSFAFSWTSFEEITIPTQLKLIGMRAFSCCIRLKRIKIPSNSTLQTVEDSVFNLSSIEEFSIPSSLVELKDEWCINIKKLNKIDVSPFNPRYSILNNEMLIGKSSIEQENYDVLVFCVRSIQKVKVPSFINNIGPWAFNECNKIQTVDFEVNSQLQIIGGYAFSKSSISCIVIPSNVLEIKENVFLDWHHLQIIEMNEILNKDFFFQDLVEGNFNVIIMVPNK